MNSAGAHELGYASVAIVGALLDRLVINKVISRSDAAAILDDAITTLKGLGNLASVPGASFLATCPPISVTAAEAASR
jgi:hypothetical protein